MSSVVKTPVFRDLDLNMKVHPVTGKLIIRKNNDSVKQALKCLILTDRGERPFRPAFGSDIRRQLFDLMDPGITTGIDLDVRLAAANYEERVQILNVAVDGVPEENGLQVNISFRTITNQTPSNLVLSLEALR